MLAPAAARQANESAGLKTAVFAGGCFWGVEGVFSHVAGVTSAVSGYHGGTRGKATYDRVSAGGTGHAEAVRVTYDPAKVRYDQLLRMFFSVVADPTQLNRQGPDSGRNTARRWCRSPRSSGWSLPPISRSCAPRGCGGRRSSRGSNRCGGSIPAEDYHQDFMREQPASPLYPALGRAQGRALQRLFPAHYKRASRRLIAA